MRVPAQLPLFPHLAAKTPEPAPPAVAGMPIESVKFVPASGTITVPLRAKRFGTGEIKRHPPLPDGAVLPMESLVSRAADAERTRAAAEKTTARLAENLSDAGPEAERIAARFASELRHRGLAPKNFYDAAMKIAAEELGPERFARVRGALSKTLWVASRYEFKAVRDPAVIERYRDGEAIPDSIRDADTARPHTIGDIPGYLRNRLGETLTDLLKNPDVGIEVFIGPRDDMPVLYQNLDPPRYLKGELGGLSSTEFYLFTDAAGKNPVIVASGISNATRFRHQLWQFRHAGLDFGKIRVRGTFDGLRARQTAELRAALASLPVKPAIAVVGQRWWPMETLGKLAGITGIEGAAYGAIKPTQLKVGPFLFDYVIVEVAGGPGRRDKVGLVAMRMPNGSLAGLAVDELIAAGVSHVALAGAGGSLDDTASVGDYRSFTRAEYAGQSAALADDQIFLPDFPDGFPLKRSGGNLTVNSPLEETREWFDDARGRGFGVVDVESFHILDACKRAAARGKTVRVTPGLFLSDVVGRHALVEKIGGNDAAYRALESFLSAYLSQVGIRAVYGENGTRYVFAVPAAKPNPVLVAAAQEIPDAARSSVLAMRKDMAAFSVLGNERRRVEYPDLATLMAHKKVFYVSPRPDDPSGFARFLDALRKDGSAEKVFLSLPPDAPPVFAELCRAKGVETICLLDNAATEFPGTDYVIPKDTDLMRLNEAIAIYSHAAIFFDDPARHHGLLRFLEGEGRAVFTPAGADISELARYEIAHRSFDNPETLAREADRAFKLNAMERWLARDHPGVKVVPPSGLDATIGDRFVIAVTGSSRDSEYDIPRTRAILRDFLSGLDPKRAVIATTGSSIGAERLVHEAAREFGFTIVGFFTTMGIGQPVDADIIVPAAFKWSGKSVPLLSRARALVTISGRASIRQELAMARRAGILLLPVAGSGMETDKFLSENPGQPGYSDGGEMARAVSSADAALAGVEKAENAT